MIKVLNINKEGKKIISYTCTDGNKTVDLTKEQLSNFISAKQVTNATQQNYKGTLIIRVKEAVVNKKQNNRSVSKEQINVKREYNRIKPLIIDRTFIEQVKGINSTASIIFKPYTDIAKIRNRATVLGLDIKDINGALIIYSELSGLIQILYDGKMLLGEPKFKKRKTEMTVRDEYGRFVTVKKPWPSCMDDNGRIIGYSDNPGIFESTKFKTIDIRGLDCSKTRYFTQLFYKCEAKEILLEGIDTSSLIDISYMFEQVKIDKLDISSINFSKIISARAMFLNSEIRELNLGKFNLDNLSNSQVTNMLFFKKDCEIIYCDNSETDKFTNFVKNGMFLNKSVSHRYYGIDIPGLEKNIESVKEILSTVTVPKIIGCPNLEKVYACILEERKENLNNSLKEYEDRLNKAIAQKKAEDELNKKDPYIKMRVYSNSSKKYIEGGDRLSRIIKLSGSEIMHRLIENVCGQLTDGMWENSRDGLMMGSATEYSEEYKVTFISTHIFSNEAEARKYYARKIKECVKQEFKDKNLDPVSNWSRTNQLELGYLDCTVSEAYQAYDELLGRKKRV